MQPVAQDIAYESPGEVEWVVQDGGKGVQLAIYEVEQSEHFANEEADLSGKSERLSVVMALYCMTAVERAAGTAFAEADLALQVARKSIVDVILCLESVDS